MATNDPNKPDNVTYIDPGNKTPEAGGEPPAPEMTAEEAAALAGEGERALHDIGEEQLEPPAPFDMSGEQITDHGNVGEAEKTAGLDKEPAPPEAPAAEEQAPVKKGRGGRPPKADKSEKATEPPDKAAPAAEEQAPAKKGRGGKPPKADKADKTPDAGKPKKPDRAPRPPKAPKEEKTAPVKEQCH